VDEALDAVLAACAGPAEARESLRALEAMLRAALHAPALAAARFDDAAAGRFAAAGPHMQRLLREVGFSEHSGGSGAALELPEVHAPWCLQCVAQAGIFVVEGFVECFPSARLLGRSTHAARAGAVRAGPAAARRSRGAVGCCPRAPGPPQLASHCPGPVLLVGRVSRVPIYIYLYLSCEPPEPSTQRSARCPRAS
jgi:hypothetical protein